MHGRAIYEATFKLDQGHVLEIKVKISTTIPAGKDNYLLDNMAILYLLKNYNKVKNRLLTTTNNLIILTKTIDECLVHHKKSAEKKGFQSYGYIMSHVHNFKKLLNYNCITILDLCDIEFECKKNTNYDEGDLYIINALQLHDIKYLFSHDPTLKELFPKKTIEEDKILDYL